MKQKLLIDADVIVYRFSFANENRIEFDPGDELCNPDPASAKSDSDAFIDALRDKLKIEDYLLCFSDDQNFRKTIFPAYKANRRKNRKPQLIKPLKRYLRSNHPFRLIRKLEADDVIGILATRHPGRYVICSIDKDFLQIPGEFYNWNNGEFRRISEAEADYWHKIQTLIGDTVDNYKGCPNIGPVKAHRALEDDDSWDTVFSLFESKGLDYDYFLTQARMARILRDSDYNAKKNEVILWTPPNDTE